MIHKLRSLLSRRALVLFAVLAGCLLFAPSLRAQSYVWGQTVTLTAANVGGGNYQWYFNGAPIGGATSSSYTINSLQFTNAGLYQIVGVVISNGVPVLSSSSYQVTVNAANVGIGTCPMLYVTGTVGYAYSIQSTTNMSNTNGWVTLTNITLGSSSLIWTDTGTDTSRPTHPRKFYRVGAAIPSVGAVTGMALIPAGSFTMGDTLDGTGDAVTVTVSAFYMDTNVVSKAQWDDVYNWAITHGYTFNGGFGKAATHPVHSVNWFDSVKWCNARSEKEGRTPAYYTDAGLTTVYRSGQLSPSVNWAAGYRLPTEAEWEKAARGGLHQNRFPWGNTISHSLANFYNYGGESYQTGPTGYNAAYAGALPNTSPVGSFAPNGYGLFDMAGNVFQWCWDWYGTPYAGGTDPRGAAAGSNRVLRGGSWDSTASTCQSAYRLSYINPTSSPWYFGFRSVLPPGQ